MSEWNMLVWLTHLGLSVAIPLALFVGLAVWLKKAFSLGVWVLLIGLFIGTVCSVYGFRQTLKEMEHMERRRERSSSDLGKKKR